MQNTSKKQTIDSVIEVLYGKYGMTSQMDNILIDLFNGLEKVKQGHFYNVQDENLAKHRAVMIFIKGFKDSLNRFINKRTIGA